MGRGLALPFFINPQTHSIMQQKKITIEFNGKKYEVKLFSYRALFTFEELAGKPFSEASTLRDNILYLYCLLSSNQDFTYSFDEFLDILEDNPDALNKLSEELQVEAEKEAARKNVKKK